MVFIDFLKAFDAIGQTMDNVWIDMLLIENIFQNAFLHIKIDKETKIGNIKVKVRSVRVTIWPKLFTPNFEDIFKWVPWENKAIKLDEPYLCNLRFVVDIEFLSDNRD